MEKGLPVDYTRGKSDGVNQRWGTEISIRVLNVDIKNERKIESFRCKLCGYLEQYAK